MFVAAVTSLRTMRGKVLIWNQKHLKDSSLWMPSGTARVDFLIFARPFRFFGLVGSILAVGIWGFFFLYNDEMLTRSRIFFVK